MKVFIIGVDGATFDLMKPWIAEGKLPTFAALMREGAHGALPSCLPPNSAPAWSSFMTGKNPGKHGVFHFTEPAPDSYEFRCVNAATRRAPSLWRILSDHGLRVGVMNVPMTYPPEPVNGFLISGLDTPSEQTEFTYPRELKRALRQAVPHYRLDARFLGHVRDDASRAAVLKEMQDIERSRTDAMLYLMKQQPLDFGMVVFTSTDQAQHHFWRYLREGGAFGDAVLRIYQNVDENVQRILNHLPDETTVILMSDHGAGALSQRIFYVNRWLEQQGLLRRKPQKAGMKSVGLRCAQLAESWLRRHLPESAKRRLVGMFPQAQTRLATMTSLGGVDWSQTQAFASEMDATAASIYVNDKKRFPQGTVEAGRAYEELCQRLKDELLALRDPDTGEPIIKGVFHRDELYYGDCVELAPDLIIAWWEESACAVKPSFRGGDKDRVFDWRPTDDLGWSGGHRRDGILMLRGRDIKRDFAIHDAGIMDVMPTVLYLMGLPIPEDVDGKVLLDAFEPERTRQPILITAATGTAEANGHGYSEEEAKEMAEKLRGLGYLE